MTLRRYRIAALSLLCAAVSLAERPVSREDVFPEHLRFLASDELKGRGNNLPELDRAADYIARYFEAYGLEPAGDEGSYSQEFEITVGYKQGENNTLSFFGLPDQSVHLELGRDYWPLTYGGEPFTAAPVVFAGFGISAPEYNYDDYRELDVHGKVVAVYDHEPREHAENSPFDGRELTPHATVTSKVITAKQRGALALLLLPDSFNHGPQSEEANLHATVEDLGMPAVRLSREWADRLLELSGRDPKEIRRWINGHLTPYSFHIEGVQCSLQLDFTKVRRKVRNVVGKIPGRSQEAILIGAHYDHLGLGGNSSLAPDKIGEIHNGADDNASGTAGLLQLAHDLAGTRPSRTILLVAFAGEELGLLGSRHYAEHPSVPLEQTVAMLNMDMIGRSTGELLIGGVGTAQEFEPLLQELQRESSLTFRFAETPRGASDHLSFANKNIPVLFFFSGLHSDYHRPSDDWPKIDLRRTREVLQVVRNVVGWLDARQKRLQFVDLASSPERTAGPLRGSGRGYGPSFGSIPDMGFDQGGVRFADIRKDSPADRAGLRGGDILIEFDGKKIDNLYDFTYALRARQPGDVVTVVVSREGKTLGAEVRLEERP